MNGGKKVERLLLAYVEKNLAEIDAGKGTMSDIKCCALRPFDLPQEIKEQMTGNELMSYTALASHVTRRDEALERVKAWMKKNVKDYPDYEVRLK